MDGNRPEQQKSSDGWRDFFGVESTETKQDQPEKDESPREAKPTEKKAENKDEKPPKSDTNEQMKQEKRLLKRKQVIRRSQAQLEDAEYRDPYQTIQYSPIERVQLAVARQIVSLDTRLRTDESLDDGDVASLEHSIDFMGLMADKLLDPELETAPEVEAAVAVLLEPLLTPADDETSEVGPDEQQRMLKADMKDMTMAIASTTPVMIERWLDEDVLAPSASPSDTAEPERTERTDGRKKDATALERPETAKPAPTYELTRVDPEQILETANDYRRMVPTVMRVLKKERKKQRQATPTTNAAGGSGIAALTDTHEDTTLEENVQPKRGVSGIGDVLRTVEHPTTVRLESPIVKPVRREPEHRSSSESVTERHDHDRRDTDHPVTSKPNKKVEHMSLHELLHEARDIPVGHGQFLRRAYESGEIDRDALVDVIKSYRKGKDYRREFSAKRAAHRYRTTSSAETAQSHEREPSGNVGMSGGNDHAANDSTSTIGVPPVERVSPGPTIPSPAPSASVPLPSNVSDLPSDDREALLGSILSDNRQTNDESPLKKVIAVAAVGGGVALVGWLIFGIL
jgi:hypothetical protein